MPKPVPKLNIRQFSAGENKMLNLAMRQFVKAAKAKDVQGLYNPPTLRVAGCSAAYNKAFNAGFREELAGVLGPPEQLVIPAVVVGIIVGVVGNIIGNIIGQKVS